MNPTVFHGDVIQGGDWRTREFRGQRVAVVASSEEAGRIVPHVVRTASSVKVFQRSPAWVLATELPVESGPIRRLAARLHLRRSVVDPWLRRQLRPTRDQRDIVAVRPGYYAALQQPNCKLYTWPVYAVVEDGIRSAEGVEHHVDVIIVGSGIEIAPHSTREERIA